jgi:hypothetical protein
MFMTVASSATINCVMLRTPRAHHRRSDEVVGLVMLPQA